MHDFPRPLVVVSKCLGFDACRYNGQTLRSEVVERLKPFVDYRPVCAEVEIGLGVPRDPLRVVTGKEGEVLLQPATGRDFTAAMGSFTQRFLAGLDAVDGSILKNRSPSCGVADVKVYPSKDRSAASGKTAGFFGREVVARYGKLAVEDEGRLTNHRIREHFFTKLFALASFRAVSLSGRPRDLVEYHTRNKFLLMCHSQVELREMGRIVAAIQRRPWPELISDYCLHLLRALAQPLSTRSAINAAQHALGYVSTGIDSREKAYFLQVLDEYRSGKLPLSVPVKILGSWIVRFRVGYLSGQTFFEPYPPALVEITDSGKGRDL